MDGAKRPGGGAGDGRRSRRTGITALLLLCGTTTGSLVLAGVYHLGAAAVVVVIAGGVPGLYLAWATYRDERRDAARETDLSLAEIADRVAVSIRSTWESEAAVRRLNDPYPLPVSWDAADASLAGEWEALVMLATTGAGGKARSSPGSWAAGPAELAGSGDDLVDTLGRVPTGRLVVLGEPGAGKTTLMVRLLLDLTARRDVGAAVPVLVTLASWDPAGQDLFGFIGQRLLTEHPGLAEAAPPGSGGGNRAEALLASGLVVPLLDGLDELPQLARLAAIIRINDALRPDQPLVLTCRTEQYRATVNPPSGAGAAVRGAAAVELRPLAPAVVAAYLRHGAPTTSAATRWRPVLDALGTQAPVSQALTTPLMAGLAHAIYNPRPGEGTGDLPDPAELRSPLLRARDEVEAHLFDAFIRASYRSARGRWRAAQAEQWLVFLARYLEYVADSPDLAWWELWRAAPPAAAQLTWTGLIGTVIAIALAGGDAAKHRPLFVVLLLILGEFFVVGLVAQQYMKPRQRPPSRGIGPRAWRVWFTLGLGGAFGVGIGELPPLNFGIRTYRAELPAHSKSPAELAAFALIWALTMFLIFAFQENPGDISAAVSPEAIRARDRRVAQLWILQLFLAFPLLFGFFVLLVAPSGPSRVPQIAESVAFAAVGGLVVGAASSVLRAAWPTEVLTRVWLTGHRCLPWSVAGFLADAHERGVLRQAGAVYQFRHIALQRRLANRLAQRGYLPQYASRTRAASLACASEPLLSAGTGGPAITETGWPQPEGGLPLPAATGLLADRIGHADPSGATEIARELRRQAPLLEQAAIMMTRDGLTCAAYLEQLRSARSSRYLTRVTDGLAPAPAWAAAVLLAVTSAESGDEARSCRSVLDLMSLLSEAGVARRILYGALSSGPRQRSLRRWKERVRRSVSDPVSTVNVDAALERLESSSLLEFTTDRSAVVARPLVLGVTRARLVAEGGVPAVAATVAAQLETAVDDSDPENVRQTARHAAALYRNAGSALEDREPRLVQDLLQLRLWSASLLDGLPDASGELIELFGGTLVADCERILGADHPDTLDCCQILAASYTNIGRLAEGVELAERAVAGFTKILGIDHTRTLESRLSLAHTYRRAGWLDDATVLYTTILAARERVLGMDDPATIDSRRLLSYAYKATGNLAKAIPLAESTLDQAARVLGADDYGTTLARENLGHAYNAAGRTAEAISLYERTVADCERLLANDRGATLTSRTNLAVAYANAGRLTEAASLNERILADREELSGDDHPDTLIVRLNLAANYHWAGRTREAISLYERCVESSRRVLGAEHPFTLDVAARLGRAYQEVGQFDQAIELCKPNLAIYENKFGSTDPKTLAAADQLAGAYLDAGWIADATEMYKRSAELHAQAVGADHPRSQDARYGLAVAYLNVGRVAEAIDLFEHVLADRERTGAGREIVSASRQRLAIAYLDAGRVTKAIPLLERSIADYAQAPPRSPLPVLSLRGDLALAYRAAGRLASAITLNRAVLDGYEKMTESDSPDALTARSRLARCLREAGRLAESASLEERTITDGNRSLGSDHPATRRARGGLAAVHFLAGRVAHAAILFEQYLADCERVLGASHRQTLAARADLAAVHQDAGRPATALRSWTEISAEATRVLGTDDPLTMSFVADMAGACRDAGRLDEAVGMYERALAACERVLDPDDPQTLLNRAGLADAYLHVGRLDEAVGMYERALAACERVLDPDHPQTLLTRAGLADAYRATGRLSEAITLHESVLATRERVLDPDHPKTILNRRALAVDYRKIGRVAAAIDLLERVLAELERVLDPDHPQTLRTRAQLASAYQEAGLLPAAIETYENALADCERTLGPEHPCTQMTRTGLASAYNELGR
jgi:tetratricopeptide (TPR) repeat protein